MRIQVCSNDRAVFPSYWGSKSAPIPMIKSDEFFPIPCRKILNCIKRLSENQFLKAIQKLRLKITVNIKENISCVLHFKRCTIFPDFLKARSHCTGRCQEDTKCKKLLPFIEKRYASIVYSLHTYFIPPNHQTFVH